MIPIWGGKRGESGNAGSSERLEVSWICGSPGEPRFGGLIDVANFQPMDSYLSS